VLSLARDAKLSIYQEKSKQGWQMNYAAWDRRIVPEYCRQNKGEGTHILMVDLRNIVFIYVYKRVFCICGPRYV